MILIIQEEYYNQSTRAAILVDIDDHIMAYTFGYGRYLLEDEAIIKDFGVKFVLNIIDSDKLKGLEKITLNQYMVQSKQVAGREVSFNTLELDKVRDLVKQVSGQPIVDDYGTSISGSDSLCIRTELDEVNILDLSKDLYNIYSSDKYKAEFEWYDNIQIEKNKSVINALNKSLMDSLMVDPSNVLLLLPEITENMVIDEISFTEKGKKYEYRSISIVDYFRENDKKLTFDDLEKMYMYIHNTSDGEIEKIRLKNCLNFETVYNHTPYFYYQSDWYKVSEGFFNETMNYLRGLPVSTLDFADCYPREIEADYTKRVCAMHEDYLLMDRKLVRQLEVCDILTRNKEFIHIKPWKASSTLSHLLSQGRVAGDLLLNDISFRIETIEKIKKLDNSFDGVIGKSYTASDYKIIYAVIYKEDKSVVERLPFFSKINLRQAAETLIQMGYKVEVKQIKRLEEI